MSKPAFQSFTQQEEYPHIDDRGRPMGFWNRFVETPSGCFEWQGTRQNGGYGRVRNPFLKKNVYVHITVWEHFNGSIPFGFNLHHKCENPSCANPDHLSLLSPTIHHREHKGINGDFCCHGHEWKTNTVMRSGYRRCIQCERDRANRYNERKRVAHG